MTIASAHIVYVFDLKEIPLFIKVSCDICKRQFLGMLVQSSWDHYLQVWHCIQASLGRLFEYGSMQTKQYHSSSL